MRFITLDKVNFISKVHQILKRNDMGFRVARRRARADGRLAAARECGTKLDIISGKIFVENYYGQV